MVIAHIQSYEVEVTSSKALPEGKTPMELANRIDVNLTIRNPDGTVLVHADRFGYTSSKGDFAANASPLTNLQRFILAHAR